MITIDNLSKSYGSHKVLDSINLSFEKAKVYGIVGNNGSGKTTLFKCIAGLENFSGTINSEFKILKNNLGFLETNPVIMSRITGWEYLKLFCVARHIHEDDFESQNIFELPLSQYAETYSTGMKKKLALMAILLQKNKVFILDEPFNGVDIQSNILISAIIEKLKKQNKTLIIASHIFSTLSLSCDKILHLNAGKIDSEVTKESYKDLESKIKNDIIQDRIDKLSL